MSNDKRSVATDALETLGSIIGTTEARDAIHLAVEPIEAGGPLRPGQHVMIQNGKGYACRVNEGVGVADPFLATEIQPGQRFWLVVYPRTITSLRHVWEHPAFSDPEPSTVRPVATKKDKAASEAWLRAFISGADCPDYETVVATALDNRDPWDSDYLHFEGRDAHGEIPPEFWDHLEVVTGRAFGATERASYFSCSC